ncbi:zinc-dependent alcohol dehydrogenase [Mrakia frigida]|uniref:zinc-dependent alcohol dehydrogenase n=1 Tax=Mrakia frigida TaxID=29902 RepID=UPI003FCC1C81
MKFTSFPRLASLRPPPILLPARRFLALRPASPHVARQTIFSAPSYDIPLTQKAVTFDAIRGPITIQKAWPVTQPEELLPGQVLVRVVYTGVCHTDLHAWLGDWPLKNKLPLVGGHEGSGYVAAIGKQTNTDLKIGDAVGIKWLADSCLHCEECRKGYESSCAEAKNSGFSVDGSFQQWAVSYANHLTPLPDGFPLEEAAPILCAGVTVYKALKTAALATGEVVVVPGAGGGLGHLAVQYATAMGYRVIAIDSGEDKRALLASYGVEDFIDYTQGDVVKAVQELTGGHGAHASIVVASGAQAYEQALQYLRPHGALIAVGMPPDGDIKASVFWTVVKSHRIIGSYVGNRQDAIEALEIAAAGKVHTTFTIEDLDNLPSVFERMRAATLNGRVVLDCQ